MAQGAGVGSRQCRPASSTAVTPQEATEAATGFQASRCGPAIKGGEKNQAITQLRIRILIHSAPVDRARAEIEQNAPAHPGLPERFLLLHLRCVVAVPVAHFGRILNLGVTSHEPSADSTRPMGEHEFVRQFAISKARQANRAVGRGGLNRELRQTLYVGLSAPGRVQSAVRCDFAARQTIQSESGQYYL